MIALVGDLFTANLPRLGVDSHDLLAELNVRNFHRLKRLDCIVVSHDFAISWPATRVSPVSRIFIAILELFLRRVQRLINVTFLLQCHLYDCILHYFALLADPLADGVPTRTIPRIDVLLKRVIACRRLLEIFLLKLTRRPERVNILLGFLFPLVVKHATFLSARENEEQATRGTVVEKVSGGKCIHLSLHADPSCRVYHVNYRIYGLSSDVSGALSPLASRDGWIAKSWRVDNVEPLVNLACVERGLLGARAAT